MTAQCTGATSDRIVKGVRMASMFLMSLLASDWENQRAFLAVLRTGSLSAAARELGLAQPTVRRRIEALEQALGTPLFTRSPAGLLPTEAARTLGPHAEAMAAAAAAFQRAASGPRAEISGTVRITASDMIGTQVLPGLIEPLMARHPRLTLEVHLSNRTQDLLRQEADIAVRMVRPTQSALVIRAIGIVRLGLFATPAFVERHGMPERLSDLSRYPLIGPDRDAADLRATEQLLGPDVPGALTYRTDNHPAQFAAVRAGLGIGVCQVNLAARPPALIPILPEAFEMRLDTYLVMHEDLKRVRRVRVVFDHLARTLGAYCHGTTEPTSGVL
ncbi:transcriptional regulator [Azorhizobium caulinodans ORS 571]|uniref:Transcriptional regulator n=2 Tax=Azorhizobium caulinodans TaxID=7 RepID=A8IDY1_AZOC5|nr:transcriptional regulator [Azorhizobium caulinodans ORS 571]